MNRPVLKSIRITFARDGIEYAVTYQHGEHGDGVPAPGTKKRATTAARMVRAGLERALEGLDTGEATWGGFATDTRTSRDTIMIEGKPQPGRESAA